jgi:alpha-amylase/alpha-mannosidase (GH57 family)
MVKLALLWHMHQPYYEDLATGEHILPWVRLHATKDYWGMVALLDEFPEIRATFNLVPSLLVQVEAYAAARAVDRHLLIGMRPADLLTSDDRQFLVANGFHAPVERSIRPNGRYGELYMKRRSPESFTTAELRDLQVWHKLVWMDPDWRGTDLRLRGLIEKGRDYSEADKLLLRDVELELLSAVVPAYRKAAASGRVELTTSPFYHPILPLLCDTDLHLQAHPHSPLPRKLFAYSGDAREQVVRALDYHERLFGARPRGLWPSEGAVSDEVIALLAELGVEWTATDEEILARSLSRPLTAADRYQAYIAGVGTRTTRMLFRDHQLSDLIGFAYQSWDTAAAVSDFMSKVREAGRRFVRETGREVAIVPVILDGENAWEHYAGGGRPFLRGLYQALQDAEDIETVTMSEAAATATEPLPAVFPGSWINGDFYIWAGHHDDHTAWAQLAAARSSFEEFKAGVSAASRNRAFEELLIAEGSDWFWWYGDDHSSDHDREFDDLFRRHVRNVYRALGRPAPDDLHVSNITTQALAAGPITLGVLTSPSVDGRSRDFTQWAGSISVPLGGGGGTMHRVAGQLVRSLRVAGDERNLYLRVDGADLVRQLLTGEVSLALLQDQPQRRKLRPRWAVAEVATAAVAHSELGAKGGDRVSLLLLVLDSEGHVIEQHPAARPVQIEVPVPEHDAINWVV